MAMAAQRQATEVVDDPLRNRGVAFDQEQRKRLGLTGRLPSAVLSLDQQAQRVHQQLQAQPRCWADARTMVGHPRHDLGLGAATSRTT